MNNKISTQKNKYAFGYSKSRINLLSERTFDLCCRFLQPYIKKGMKILDCGCGPGTITLGIAQLVYPAEVVAIDISEEQLALANENAKKSKIENIVFKLASIEEIPFLESSFDLVFSHAVLDHLQDREKAIREQKRVVKINGIVAARSFCRSAMLIYPNNEILKESLEVYYRPLVNNNKDHDYGMKLGEAFIRAGLKNINHTFNCSNDGAKRTANFMAEALLDSKYHSTMVNNGEITLSKLQDFSKAWLDFGKIPGACFCSVWGEVIGTKV